ncbi:hypothetical protein MMC34_002481 [Xylographa carneopallida]|nr:hypothetical protein [Xylographa carneopallida]
MEGETQPAVEIDPRGDVILEFTNPDGKKASLLVSSKVMSLASPVFDNMFNSSFSECYQNHAAGKILIVLLPQDDAEAFTIICKVIHHRTDEVSQKITVDCIVNIAMLCDKYKVVRAISPSSAAWFQAPLADIFVRSDFKLLDAAFVLDAPYAFSRISWDIIMSHTGLYGNPVFLTKHGIFDGDLRGMCHQALQTRIRWLTRIDILAELEARAATLCAELVEAVEQPITEALASVTASRYCCTSAQNEVMRYLSGLVIKKVFPVSIAVFNTGLSRVMGSVMEMTEPRRTDCGASRKCEYCSIQVFSYTKAAWEWKEKVLSAKRGICLDCVRTGRESLRKKQCRIKHTD